MSSVLSAASIPFLANFILARHLSQDSYAFFALISSFVTFVGAISLLGQPIAFTMIYFSKERIGFAVRSAKLDSQKILLLGISISVFLWGMMWKIKLSSEGDFALLCIVAIFIASKAWSDYINGVVTCLDRYKAYAATTAFAGLLVIISILVHPNILFFFFIGSVAYGVSAFVLYFYTTKIINADTSQDYVTTPSHLLKLGWVAVPGMMVTSGLTFGERSLISHYLDNRSLAVYAMASMISVSGARVLVNALLKSSQISLLSALQNENDAQIRKIFSHINLQLLGTLAIFSLCMITIGKYSFTLLFGNKYLESIVYIIPLFSISIIEGVGVIMSQPIVQRGKLSVVVTIGVCTTLINLLVNFIFIPIWGLYALLVSFFISTLISVIVTHIKIKCYGYKMKFPYYLVSIIIVLNTISYFIMNKLSV